MMAGEIVVNANRYFRMCEELEALRNKVAIAESERDAMQKLAGEMAKMLGVAQRRYRAEHAATTDELTTLHTPYCAILAHYRTLNPVPDSGK